ncbi:MAG TPA: Rad52/Rad22 family DNA repair protein, partial [Gemmataceae bacterium]|nr:Rad52/Rad22 family DNA repair protein [Gemmataceae bacterium]
MREVMNVPVVVSDDEIKTITQALSAPFDLKEVKFKPQMVQGDRALALAYVDARVIQDRLDDVLGVEGWQDEYEVLPDNSVICRLRLKIGGEWVTKMDVGGPSEQPDGGDRIKAAFSDALKRAAVKFGVGRYLYRLPSQWVDYDPAKRQFRSTPSLPAFALPNRTLSAAPPNESTHTMPTSGEELRQRLLDYEAKLVAQGVCEKGDLLRHVEAAGDKAGFGPDLTTWTKQAFNLAAKETKTFENRRQKKS